MNRRDERATALVACPACGAKPSERCRNLTEKPPRFVTAYPHVHRFGALDRLDSKTLPSHSDRDVAEKPPTA